MMVKKQCPRNNGLRNGLRNIMDQESRFKQPEAQNIDQCPRYKKQELIIKNHTELSSIENDF